MKTPRAICVAAGLMLASVAAQPGACPEDSPAHSAVVHPQADADERGRLLAVGRKLFVARCSRCHGERGEKSLSTGLPLSQRKLMPEQLARSVKGRLQDCTEEQRWAVQLYIESFLNQESRERTSN
jgi:mono/diheme cytochrome c family protein